MFALLLPDLALIALGFALHRWTAWGAQFWAGLEKLNYFCLFPLLLISSITKNPITWSLTWPMIAAAWLAVGGAAALALLARPALRPDRLRWLSSMQCTYRFNTFIVLAVASRVGGPELVAAAAICAGACVPLVNVLAVSSLARHTGVSVGRELATNPLVIATVVAIGVSSLGLPLPEPMMATVDRAGGAAIPLGLLSVGAALTWRGAIGDLPLMIWMVAVRVLPLPLLAFGMAALLNVTGDQRTALIAVTSLPTATSAYILAARMGGDGPFVAVLVSVSTCVTLFSAQLWLSVAVGG